MKSDQLQTRRRQLARVALAVARFKTLRPRTLDLPAESWQSCVEAAKLLKETERRHWPAARAECGRRLYGQLCDLRYRLDAIADGLREVTESTQTSAREIYDDLVALETEFSGLWIATRGHELSVTTEPITLDGISLGPFRIVVDWSGGALWYRIVAVAPNPAANSDEVTHPHVSEESLCEGEGRAAIRRCLSTGRLWDFFMIVNQTLSTYNAESAFVTLDDWEGRSCSRCGDHPDGAGCERCGCELCEECSVSCGTCGHSQCDNCREGCSGCGDTFCSGCLTRCQSCHEHCCEECLDDRLCDRCCEAANEENEADVSDAEGASSEAVAAGVGQAVVSA